MKPTSVAISLCLALTLGWRCEAQIYHADSPVGFFTNVANRLLAEAGYTFDASGIQIYPTNCYTANVHRMFQLAANIYDCTTNRTYGEPTATNGFPTVFRPIFGRAANDPNIILITGFAEVTDASAFINTPVRDLQLPKVRQSLQPTDMLYGIPAVIGARQGFPNFNEFAMQTGFYVSRLLEFRRSGTDGTGPVHETNQMYVASITNYYGIEAWNSYSNAYPRNLHLLTYVDMFATVTNEAGNLLLNNQVSRTGAMDIAAGTWSGWTTAQVQSPAFKIPFGLSTNNFLFLTNSTYKQSTGTFWPLTQIFERNTGFTAPLWMLNLRTRVRFSLVDTDVTPNRVVDYVNLDYTQPPVDIMATLRSDADCRPPTPASYNVIGNLFCTNRNLGNPLGPTYGIMNQVAVGLNGTADWKSFNPNPAAGTDVYSAVDGFRYNLMGLSPIYPIDLGKTFTLTNVFYAPYSPQRTINIRTKWQANDPLVHDTIGDLYDLATAATNIDFTGDSPPLNNLGNINTRYSPWGGNPLRTIPQRADFDPSIKDPLVGRSDSWEFPTNKIPNVGWLGRVHRGTPWQTLNLKATNTLDLAEWQKWVGTTDPVEAERSRPIYDSQVVTLLGVLFSTNDPRGLASINQPDAASWRGVLDGIIAYTNGAPVVMSSNSPQAAFIAAALDSARQGQPQGLFQQVADLVTIPQLTMASPWIAMYPTVSDAAFEAIPSQLLSRLRPDSIGTATPTNGMIQVKFTGADAYSYAIELSSNLLDWAAVATNRPLHGVLNYIDGMPPGIQPRFYRSELLP